MYVCDETAPHTRNLRGKTTDTTEHIKGRGGEGRTIENISPTATSDTELVEGGPTPREMDTVAREEWKTKWEHERDKGRQLDERQEESWHCHYCGARGYDENATIKTYYCKDDICGTIAEYHLRKVSDYGSWWEAGAAKHAEVVAWISTHDFTLEGRLKTRAAAIQKSNLKKGARKRRRRTRSTDFEWLAGICTNGSREREEDTRRNGKKRKEQWSNALRSLRRDEKDDDEGRDKKQLRLETRKLMKKEETGGTPKTVIVGAQIQKEACMEKEDDVMAPIITGTVWDGFRDAWVHQEVGPQSVVADMLAPTTCEGHEYKPLEGISSEKALGIMAKAGLENPMTGKGGMTQPGANLGGVQDTKVQAYVEHTDQLFKENALKNVPLDTRIFWGHGNHMGALIVHGQERGTNNPYPSGGSNDASYPYKFTTSPGGGKNVQRIANVSNPQGTTSLEILTPLGYKLGSKEDITNMSEEQIDAHIKEVASDRILSFGVRSKVQEVTLENSIHGFRIQKGQLRVAKSGGEEAETIQDEDESKPRIEEVVKTEAQGDATETTTNEQEDKMPKLVEYEWEEAIYLELRNVVMTYALLQQSDEVATFKNAFVSAARAVQTIAAGEWTKDVHLLGSYTRPDLCMLVTSPTALRAITSPVVMSHIWAALGMENDIIKITSLHAPGTPANIDKIVRDFKPLPKYILTPTDSTTTVDIKQLQKCSDTHEECIIRSAGVTEHLFERVQMLEKKIKEMETITKYLAASHAASVQASSSAKRSMNLGAPGAPFSGQKVGMPQGAHQSTLQQAAQTPESPAAVSKDKKQVTNPAETASKQRTIIHIFRHTDGKDEHADRNKTSK